MKKFWSKIGNWFKTTPWYGWVFGVLMVLLDIAAYAGASAIIKGSGWLETRAIVPKIPMIDDAIPLIPYFWAQVYILTFLFWLFGPIVASRTSKQNFINYMIGLFGAYLIGFAIFLAVPTYMDRVKEGVIDATNNGSGFSWAIMKMTLFFDGSNYNLNLFPSFHCMIALYCYLGVSRKKEIHLWWRMFAIFFTVLIGMSTLFTKQHFIIDIPIGWLLAIFTWFLANLINPGSSIVKKWPNIFVVRKPNRQLSKQPIKK